MTAWHNEPNRKARMVEAMKEHRRLDRIARGEVGDYCKGCFISCAWQTVTGIWQESYDSESLADYLGVPPRILYRAEQIFESWRGGTSPLA